MIDKATRIALACALATAAAAARADITIGVVLPLTGPTSALGIPVNNGFKLWPDQIAGQKIRIVTLDLSLIHI